MKHLKFILLILMLFTTNVFANNYSVDLSVSGKINIVLTDKENNESIEGVELTLYKIANVLEEDNHLTYKYIDNINCDVSLDNLESKELSDKINLCVSDDLIIDTKVTDLDGKVTFDNLSLGLYLVKQTNKVKGYSSINSYLLTIPKVVDNKFIYEINSKPKTDILRLMSLTVKKVWNESLSNKNDLNRLPKYVEVGLYKNNELIDKVKLSKDNKWEYTWLDIEKSDDYNVLELNVPNGYIATYEEIDNTFIITNTKTLVQTGNNYYLVVILGSCGIILILSSIIYNKYKEHNE